MNRILSSIAITCALVGVGLAVVPAAHAQPSNISACNRLEVWVEDSLRASAYLNQFDLLYMGEKWNVGARLEMDEEKWWDPERETKLVRRYAEYHDELLGMRAGTYYATFGRGLVLRAMEDVDVRVDRDIDGIYGSIDWKKLHGQAVLGHPRSDRSSKRTNVLAGGDAEVEALPGLFLGGAYIRKDAQNDAAAEDLDQLGRPALEECAGGRVNWVHGLLDVYLEGAKRMPRAADDPHGGWTWTSAEDGYAWYGSLNVGVTGYTVLLEGKDYLRYDVDYATPPPVNQAGQPLNSAIDERGGAVLVTASPSDDLTIEAAGSYADGRDEPGKRSDTLGSIRKDWWGQGSLKVGGEWIKEEEIESHVLREHAGPILDVSYYVAEQASVILHGSLFSWTNHYRGTESQDYNEITTDLTLSLGESRSATLSVIKATEEITEFAGDDMWTSVALTWGFGHNHDLMIKFGQERGGIVCSSGICIYEPPFTGVRMVLSSRL
jgi:hypothetical protein